MARLRRSLRSAGWLLAVPVGVTVAAAAIIDLTFNDLHLRGTQVGSVSPDAFIPAATCAWCHGGYDEGVDASSTWSGSLMGLAGRDPLFFAQMATANQDTGTAGYFCMRCHVPMSFVTGHAMQVDGSTLDGHDLEGVSCHFCHSMVDPVYRPGVSPAEDAGILAALEGGPPEFYANAMFVLDASGARRGQLADAQSPHETIHSPFHTTGNFCGTCHEVGNVAVTRRNDGTYRYNALDTPTPSENPATQFPLERTCSEWRLSAFASGGVDMGGQFGGVGGASVSTCQDCHMPVREPGRACFFGPEREGLRSHSFAGAAAQVLDLISLQHADNPEVDQAAIARGRAGAVSMLERAATLELMQEASRLRVRVVNETGHKLPTGHIEGRRVWVNVRFYDRAGALVREHGAYDAASAELDEHSTTVYEMVVGLSPDAAKVTGFPAGRTGHMALADTIVRDNRIPPRGFSNSAYEAAGAPVVGAAYADGQYWSDLLFDIPPGTVRAEAGVYYQNTPKHYIEELRDNNHTNDLGVVLHDLWERTGRGAPIRMAEGASALRPACAADWDANAVVDSRDFFAFLRDFFTGNADFNADSITNSQDFFDFLMVFLSGC